MKVREIIAQIEDDGWYHVSTTGSHRQYKHPTKPGRVTVPVHGMGRDIQEPLLSRILRQAGLKKR